jgi:hypothetical protein
MVGPPSSWSRDQEESLGRLGQRTIRIARVRCLGGRPFASCQSSISHCQQVDRWDISPHDNSQPDGRCRDRSAVHSDASCFSGLQSLYRPYGCSA